MIAPLSHAAPFSDVALFGKDPAERIVAVHPILDGGGQSLMRIYHRSDDGASVRETDQPFYPFFFLSDIDLLRGFPRERFKFNLLAGENYYQYLVAVSSWATYWDAVRHVERATESREKRPDELYLINNPAQQYLMQTGRTCFKGMAFDDLHRLQLDIEAYTDGGFPNASRPQDAIIIVSLCDNRGWKKLLHLAPHVEVPGGVGFEAEAELLHHLVLAIRERDPDVIETYNGFAFDFPYIMTRCERFNVPFAIGRDASVPRSFPSSMRFAERVIDFPALEIAGRHVVDVFFQVMSFDVFKRDLPGYSLKQAARYFGFAPEDRTYIDGGEISRVWREDPARVLAYALDDVIETERLARHLSGSAFYLTQMLPMPYGQAARTGPAAKIEALFVREYLRQRHAIPKSEWGSQAVGGYTDVFVTGVVGPVIYADVESLYPSIMLNYGIKPSRDNLGMFPALLRRLTDLRLEAKGQMKQAASDEIRGELDARQSSYKVLINCFDEDTDVVTIDGIKNIRDVEIGDLVYSINPESLEVEIKPVLMTYAQHYEGPMVEIQTAFVDYLVTSNHRFLTSKFETEGFTSFEWETAADMLADDYLRRLPPLRPLPVVGMSDAVAASSTFVVEANSADTPRPSFVGAPLSRGDFSRSDKENLLLTSFPRSCVGMPDGTLCVPPNRGRDAERPSPAFPRRSLGRRRDLIIDQENLYPTIKPAQRRSVDFSGMIYCVTVADNHTLLCGRNSKFNWCGQSFYGNLGFSLAAFNDFAQADKVAATGQKILRKIIHVIRREGGLVIEVDTDGVLFVPPEGVRGEEAERAFVETLNAEMPEGIRIGFDGRFRTMLSYKKKNYALRTYGGALKFKGSSLVSRSIERFGRRFVRKAIERLMDEDVQGLHDLYLQTRDRILAHDWEDVHIFSRTETLKDTVEQYLADVKAAKRTRAASYELAIKQAQETGQSIRKGDRISYYITGTGANVTSFENCRLAGEWDPARPDENTAYYLKRLDEFARKFEPFFSEHHFRLIFSPEDLFGFSPKGIQILRHERAPDEVEDEVPF